MATPRKAAPAKVNYSLLKAVEAQFGARKRVDWTPDEKVKVWKAYLLELNVDGNKKAALERACQLLDEKRRRSLINVYPVIDMLQQFAQDNMGLFRKEKKPKVAAKKRLAKPKLTVVKPRLRGDEDPHAEEPVFKPAPEGVMPPTLQRPTMLVVPKEHMDKVMAELLAKLIKEADDRQLATVQLILEQLDTKLSTLTRTFEACLDAAVKSIEARIDTFKPPKGRKPTVLILGGLDAQRGQLQQRFPWLIIENNNGQNLKALADKGYYDLIIQWTTFANHSMENMLKAKYGNDGFITMKPGQGLSTLFDIISQRFPKA